MKFAYELTVTEHSGSTNKVVKGTVQLQHKPRIGERVMIEGVPCKVKDIVHDTNDTILKCTIKFTKWSEKPD